MQGCFVPTCSDVAIDECETCMHALMQGCADGGVGGGTSRPQFFQIRKKVGQKSAMLQESWP